MKNIIITGMSGAGKSQAAQILEDLGFFCVDNLPPQLIGVFLNLCRESASEIEKVALVTDIRAEVFRSKEIETAGPVPLKCVTEGLSPSLKEETQIVFLDASDEVLVARYQETRRDHPLAGSSSNLLAAIQEERKSLNHLRDKAQLVIDTSNLAIKDLKAIFCDHLQEDKKPVRLKVNIYSFGFKYASPMGADYVFDVRFLPNPFYKKKLRLKTGNDQAVRDYVASFKEAGIFYDKLLALLSFVIPQFKRVSKHTIEIAIGCTGGQHRSVTFANWLAADLKDQGFEVAVKHRDILKHQAGGA